MKLNIILIAIIGVLVFFLVFGHNGILKYQELSKIREKYETKIADTDKKVQNLTNELNLVRKDVSYLETLIKKDLNMKRPDEDVYILEHKQEQPKPDKKPDKSKSK